MRRLPSPIIHLSFLRLGVRLGMDVAKISYYLSSPYRGDNAMVRKLQFRTAMAVACTTLVMVYGTARAQEVPLITGKHWTESSEQLKKAYLVGIANVVQVD